jgi:hypothetical protein
MYRPSTSRRTIATRLSPRSVSPARSPPELRRDSIALRGASRGLVQFQRAGGRRVNALVPVIPADSIPREGIVPHHRFHHTATGGATGRLRRDKDVISRRKSRDCPSVDSAPESTLATPHRRGALPHHDGASNADRHAAPLVAGRYGRRPVGLAQDPEGGDDYGRVNGSPRRLRSLPHARRLGAVALR